jgi:hydroxypyruvate reductase
MKRRVDLAAVVGRALARMDVRARVAAALPPPTRPAYVVAIGKAAPAMAAGARDRYGDHVARLVVVTTDGTEALGLDVVRAGHPLPDRRSVRAAEECLAVAREAAGARGLLVVLVSGGASALVCAPAGGVRLTDKRAVTRAMLASGATIQEINVVRKHLSRIKGGGLGRAARPGQVVTLVASDVIGGAPSDVGSGPSVGDESTVAEARALLRRHATGSALAKLPLVRTGPVPGRSRVGVVACPEALAREVAAELRALGLRARALPASQEPAERAARRYLALAQRMPPRTALVRAAEPSVELPARPDASASGGRSTHLAALVARELPRGVRFLAMATDGVDGTSESGGAEVDATLRERLGDRAIANAVARFETGKLHRRAGTALPRSPTGHNLADLHVLLRE